MGPTGRDDPANRCTIPVEVVGEHDDVERSVDPTKRPQAHLPLVPAVVHLLQHRTEFERELISERTKAGLAAARARGRKGGRPFKMTPAKLRLAQAAMGKPETCVNDFCVELGIIRQTLYRFVGPRGEIRSDGEKLLAYRRMRN